MNINRILNIIGKTFDFWSQGRLKAVKNLMQLDGSCKTEKNTKLKIF